MKIIDSVWEKENLGVTSKEVVVELGDDLEIFSKVIKDLKAQYLVLKIPSGETDMMRSAQNAGYFYIENLIEVEHDLHEFIRSTVHQRLYDSLDYRQMDQKDVEMLYYEISKGMFSNDRISNDPKFSKELSAKRYSNWVGTLLKEGALPYVMLYKGEPAGFIILTSKDTITYYSVLGGGYEKFRKTGLGMVQKEQEIVRELGGKRLTTKVSSNNLNQLKALLANGFTITRIDNVFIKHSS